MYDPSTVLDSPPPQTYRVAVESHLSPEWLAMPGVVTLATGYDALGWPITSLMLEVVDRAHLMSILYEMHDLNLALLSLELVRDPGGLREKKRGAF